MIGLRVEALVMRLSGAPRVGVCTNDPRNLQKEAAYFIGRYIFYQLRLEDSGVWMTNNNRKIRLSRISNLSSAETFVPPQQHAIAEPLS